MIERLHELIERTAAVVVIAPALRHFGAVDRVELTEVDLEIRQRPPPHEELLHELHSVGKTRRRSEQARRAVFKKVCIQIAERVRHFATLTARVAGDTRSSA